MAVPRPLPRLVITPRLGPPARIRWRMVRLSDPLPETAYNEAKAQLRQLRRTARVLRNADRAAERAVKELLHHAAHDLSERRRQAGEAKKEELRQLREAKNAAMRPGPPHGATGKTPAF